MKSILFKVQLNYWHHTGTQDEMARELMVRYCSPLESRGAKLQSLREQSVDMTRIYRGRLQRCQI